jgi:hypothetical protein
MTTVVPVGVSIGIGVLAESAQKQSGNLHLRAGIVLPETFHFPESTFN